MSDPTPAEVIRAHLDEMTPERRADLALWLYASAESNALEGQHDTAKQLRAMAFMANPALASVVPSRATTEDDT